MAPRLALKQRPDAAFETLYRGHVREVYRYSLAVLGNPADAEDVTQTTFLNAYRAFHAGERPRKPANWLRTIAHNVCRQRFRQAARRPQEVAELDEQIAPGAPEEADGPSAGDIARALQSLPFNQRSALVMRELEGRRQAEIAEWLGLSESAVEALLFRARRAMREQLETSITCGEAARAISRQLDRRLSRDERASLRAHLRSCADCASFARQARAQRGAFKALGTTALPASLLSWSGAGTGAGAGVGAAAAAAAVPGAALGLKLAAGVAAVAVIAGAGAAGLPGRSARTPDRTPATQHDAGSALPAAAGGIERGLAGAAFRREAFTGASAPRTRARADSRGTKPDRKHSHAPAAAGAPERHSGAAALPGTRTRGHGPPAHANGTPTRAHGPPPHANGTPTRAHGAPAHAHGPGAPANAAPTRVHEAPPRSHGTPTRAHGAPSKPPETKRPPN